MKKILKLSLVSLCASGAVFTTQVAQANHDRSASNKDSDKQLVITEPAGADNSANANFSTSGGAEIRTSNLIGEKVVDASGKHCGTVRDAIIDLNSGRLAFLVINTRGREIAVPGNQFRAEGNEVTLNINRDRLQNAPAFSYQNLNDQNWLNQTYGYYGESWQGGAGGEVAMTSPSWQSSGTTYQSGSSYQSSGTMQSSTMPNSGFYESSGAQLNGPKMVTGREQDCYADCILHKYQAGKGSARVTDEYYWNNVAPDRTYAQYPATGNTYQNYAYNSSYNSQSSQPSQSFYSSGSTDQGQIWYGPGGRTYGSSGSAMNMNSGSSAGIISESAGASSGMNLYRSSDLVGMHIRSSNGQDLGTIRDVVLDLNSGRVAYAVIVPTGGNFGGKYLAIPPSAFTRSGADRHVLTLNMDASQLQNAPSFEPNNWPQPQNQTFIGEVYNFYHVSPYWQRGEGNWQGEHRGHMRHHEGTTNEENERNEHNEHNSQGYNQGTSNQGYSNQGSTSTEQQNLNQGSTQGSIQNQGSSTDQNNLNNSNPNQQPVNEPSGSDVKGAEHHESSSGLQNDQGAAGAQSSSSSATTSSSQQSNDELKKGAELHQNNSIKEPSGAEQSAATQPGTSGEQSSTELKSSQNQQGTATSEQNQSQPSTQSSSTSTSNPDQTSTSSSTSSATSSTENASQGLSDRVTTALRSDNNLSPISGQVQAKDENGKVALTGTVKSEAEKQQIVSKAEEIAGSGNVIDNLQVKSDNSNP